MAVRGLKQAIPDDRVRQFVQVAYQPLDAGGHQGRVRAVVPAIDQTGDVHQGPVATGVVECLEHGPAGCPVVEQHLDKLHQDELFAGDDHVGADAGFAADAEQVPRFGRLPLGPPAMISGRAVPAVQASAIRR